MGIFTTKKFATARQMRFSSAKIAPGKYNPVMDKLLKNKKIAKILDKPAERKEFYAKLKEKAAGGITKNEVREVLGYFRSGKGKTISISEAKALAKEKDLVSQTRARYAFEKNDKSNSLAGPAVKDKLSFSDKQGVSAKIDPSRGLVAFDPNKKPKKDMRPSSGVSFGNPIVMHNNFRFKPMVGATTAMAGPTLAKNGNTSFADDKKNENGSIYFGNIKKDVYSEPTDMKKAA